MHLHLPRPHAPRSDSLGSRAWAWFHQFELDRQLADGADSASSPALQARAHQLLSTHFRRELVAQLDARKLPEVEALIARTMALRDWLLAAPDCSCETLDACTLFTHAADERDAEPLQISGVAARAQPGYYISG